MPRFDFDSRDLAALPRLVYARRIPSHANAGGEHRSRRPGSGSEFLDYRKYAAGDDIRTIDWNLYARLRQPFVKVFEREPHVFFSLLIDLSASMAVGDPHSKAAFACRLACALSVIALAGGDHTSVAAVRDQLGPVLRNLRGRASLERIRRHLTCEALGGKTALSASARAFAQAVNHRGIVVLMSDFLYSHDDREAVRVLMGCGFRVLAVQILAPGDWGLDGAGPMTLEDSESSERVDVQLTPAQAQAYRNLVQARVVGLQDYCRRHGQWYVCTSPDRSLLQVIGQDLRSVGLVS